ncbi:SPOR domain-containing protein [Roseomonas sp. CAU 1739]|uniref:SPOR domain-containing protein n=1 Tax=Roseomonas sp. CAU 1739 TaxID=3140364 RepID=UPI00325AB501
MTDVPVPSYRVRPSDDGGPPWRMLAFGGGLAAVLVVGGAAWWGLSHVGGQRSVPLIEPDPRPFKVRPDDPGGLRVPNQDELIFERNRGSNAQPPGARLAPEPESPSIEALRAQVAQPAPRPAATTPAAPAVAPQPQVAARAGAPAAATSAAPAPAVSTPAATAPAATPVASRPGPAPNGRIRVQLGALTSEEAAQSEWERLARRHADLLGAFRPQVVKFERDGQATLYRLRTGGFADVAAAQSFCEQARAKQMPCTVIR